MIWGEEQKSSRMCGEPAKGFAFPLSLTISLLFQDSDGNRRVHGLYYIHLCIRHYNVYAYCNLAVNIRQILGSAVPATFKI